MQIVKLHSGAIPQNRYFYFAVLPQNRYFSTSPRHYFMYQRLHPSAEHDTEHAQKRCHHISNSRIPDHSSHHHDHNCPYGIDPAYVTLSGVRLHIKRVVNRPIHMNRKHCRDRHTNPQTDNKGSPAAPERSAFPFTPAQPPSRSP